MKTVKTKMLQSCIVGLAGIIAFSVLLLSVHAKDVFAYRELINQGRVEYHTASGDVSEKAASELHDHVDKQVLKTFGKTFSDNITVSRGREGDYTPDTEQDPGLLGRLEETFLMWRVYASLPFTV